MKVFTLMNTRSARSKSARRPYRSELRQKQAQATRALIVEGLGRVLAKPDAGDFTMGDVAKEAGVAAATVFRHFESREALFDAFVDESAQRFKLTPRLVPTFAELPQMVPRLFAFYEANGELMRAAMSTPQLTALNEPARRRRAKRLGELVRSHHSTLDRARVNEVVAQVQLITSPSTWRWFVDVHGLTTERAAELATRQVQHLLDDVERETSAS